MKNNVEPRSNGAQTINLQLVVFSHNRGERDILSEQNGNDKPMIVLVHGGFVDGSGWEDVYNILRKDGYAVSVVQNRTISLAGDVARPNSLLQGRIAR